MQKRPYVLLIIFTLIFVAFTAGFFTGRTTDKGSASYIPVATDSTPASTENTDDNQFKININTADIEQLTLLDGIGDTIAQRIIEYRQTHGAFTSIEELMNVNGIGETKFKNISDYITTGG